MKSCIPFLLSFLFAAALFSQSNINQSLSVNSSGFAPAASAQLDGLLGMDFFEGIKFCLDTVKNQVSVEEQLS